jgi:hypothetical protein
MKAPGVLAITEYDENALNRMIFAKIREMAKASIVNAVIKVGDIGRLDERFPRLAEGRPGQAWKIARALLPD